MDDDWFDGLSLVDKAFYIYLTALGVGFMIALAAKEIEDDQGQNEN